MYDMSKMKNLARLGDLAPDIWKKFQEFDSAAMADGAVPKKTKEMIAVAVALTTQCPYCIEVHTGNAKKAGCSDAELAEVSMVAAALRAGGAVSHAAHVIG